LHGTYTGIYTFEGSTAFGGSPMTIVFTFVQTTGGDVTGRFQIQGAIAAMFANSGGGVQGTLAAAGQSTPAAFKGRGVDFEGDTVFEIDTVVTCEDYSAFAGTCQMIAAGGGRNVSGAIVFTRSS
jgi:hypothetical protein